MSEILKEQADGEPVSGDLVASTMAIAANVTNRLAARALLLGAYDRVFNLIAPQRRSSWGAAMRGVTENWDGPSATMKDVETQLRGLIDEVVSISGQFKTGIGQAKAAAFAMTVASLTYLAIALYAVERRVGELLHAENGRGTQEPTEQLD